MTASDQSHTSHSGGCCGNKAESVAAVAQLVERELSRAMQVAGQQRTAAITAVLAVLLAIASRRATASSLKGV